MNKYILLGGTFDPIHLGHMAIATKLYEVFQHPITLLPTGIPPYKPKPQISTHQRIHMLNLAIDEDKRFCIDNREIKRDEHCYTYKTLTEFRQDIGYTIPVFFVIGSDSLVTLDTWDNWRSLFDLTNFIIVMRPQYNLGLMGKNLSAEFNNRQEINLKEFMRSSYGKIYTLDFEPINISSTKIRQNISNNLPFEHLLPTAVADYIKLHKLYTPNSVYTQNS